MPVSTHARASTPSTDEHRAVSRSAPRSANSRILVYVTVMSICGGMPAQDSRPATAKGEPAPPFGLAAALEFPPTNPWSLEKAELGRRLFDDPALSVDGSIACRSCHLPDHGFADSRPHSRGVNGRTTHRNAPSLFNRAFGVRYFWDGRASTLEEQVVAPIAAEDEMGFSLAGVVRRIGENPEYVAAFETAFGGPPDGAGVAHALATHVRTLLIGDSPIDRFRIGEVEALTRPERTGLWIYESKGGCWRCHSGANFTDESFHNTGVGVIDGRPEPGRAAITRSADDLGRFKTPSLRGVALSPPYMHDGSLATLRDVVTFYARGGGANPALDPLLRPVDLTDDDVDSLVAFLQALSRTAPPRVPPATRPQK